MFGLDLHKAMWDSIKDMLVEADRSTANISASVVQQELTSLQLELHASAWLNVFKKEEHTIPQSVFTRGYLIDSGKPELWEIAGEYNQALAHAAKLRSNMRPLPDSQVAQINMARVEFFDGWVDKNLPDTDNHTDEDRSLLNCVARVANRIGFDIRRNDWVGAKRLAARLADRLGCSSDLNRKGLDVLVQTVRMSYESAEASLKSVKL